VAPPSRRRDQRVAPATDGGALLAGVTNEDYTLDDPGHADPYLAAVGADGVVRWARTYQPDAPDGRANALVRTADGFVLAGSAAVDGAPRPWAVGLDAAASTRWTFRPVQEGREGGVGAALPRGDGGVLLAGSDRPVGASDAEGRTEDAWVARVDDGETDWRRRFDDAGGDRIEALAPARDGGFVVLGRRGFARDDAGVGWLAGLDRGGAVRWENTYPRDAWNWHHGLAPVGDGYLLVGTREEGPDTDERGAWLLRVDAEGRVVWQRQFETGTRGFAVHPLSDGGVLVGGDRHLDGPRGAGGWLAKIGGDPAPASGGTDLPSPPAWAGPFAAGGVTGALLAGALSRWG
jgi:hypothetical protein